MTVDIIAISTLVVAISGIVLNLWQSIKSNHFKSTCCGDCCTVDNDYRGKDDIK